MSVKWGGHNDCILPLKFLILLVVLIILLKQINSWNLVRVGQIPKVQQADIM